RTSLHHRRSFRDARLRTQRYSELWAQAQLKHQPFTFSLVRRNPCLRNEPMRKKGRLYQELLSTQSRQAVLSEACLLDRRMVSGAGASSRRWKPRENAFLEQCPRDSNSPRSPLTARITMEFQRLCNNSNRFRSIFSEASE